MSSFYTRIKLGGRLAEAEAGRQEGRQAVDGLTQANTQWDCRMDMAIASSSPGNGRTRTDGRTDGRNRKTRREGRRKSGDDQFQLIGNFSPINRTDGDGAAAAGSKVKSPDSGAMKFCLRPSLPQLKMDSCRLVDFEINPS